LLSINNIEVVYDRVILVLKGVSIEVREGSARLPRAPSSSPTGESTACGRMR
jgi:hypothetical protein